MAYAIKLNDGGNAPYISNIENVITMKFYRTGALVLADGAEYKSPDTYTIKYKINVLLDKKGSATYSWGETKIDDVEKNNKWQSWKGGTIPENPSIWNPGYVGLIYGRCYAKCRYHTSTTKITFSNGIIINLTANRS